MKSYKVLSELQSKKIKLLEDFIFESARLSDYYNWRAESSQTIRLDQLSTELDKVHKQIEELK
jgi:hypothetical protein